MVVIFGGNPMRIIMIALVLFLAGCTRMPNTDEPSLIEIFSSMTIDSEALLIHYRDDHTDIVEMVDTRDKQFIIIHCIHNHTNTSWTIIITEEWIYDTRNMQKTPNPNDYQEDFLVEEHVMDYTDYYDKVIHEANNLTTLALSLETATFYKTGNGFKLRGINPHISTALDENSMVEITYQDNRLASISYRLEKDFEATKQTSNFISGVHITYGETLAITLPELDSFKQKP